VRSHAFLLVTVGSAAATFTACIPILETPHFREVAADVATNDVTFVDVQIDARATDGGRDAIAHDASAEVEPPDASVVNDALDVIAASDGDDAIVRNDAIATIDGMSNEGGRADAMAIEAGACGRVATYSCPVPTSCDELQAALRGVYVDAKAVPCCTDSDCSFFNSGDLCCPEEDVVVGASAEADCLRSLLELTSHFSPCPPACTARACRVVAAASCIAGTCQPGG
jgi:hypothetical protein